MYIICFIFFIALKVMSGDRLSDEKIKALMQVDNGCHCGRVPIKEGNSERIVNGEEAEEHEFPWMAALMKNGEVFQCGGSLINDRYVLTAAHCINRVDVKDLTVVLGLHTLSFHKVQGTTYTAEQKIIHESYHMVGNLTIEDIALIKLKKSVQFSPSILPICLPLSRENPEGIESTVAGWGKLGINMTGSDKLMKTKLTVWTEEQCKQHEVIGHYMEKCMLCAYGEGKDVCHGDSGSPLVWNTSSRFEEIGIASWGVSCDEAKYPGVFTRVSHYLEWILSRTKDALYCNDSAF